MLKKCSVLPGRVTEKMPDAPPGSFLCSGSGLWPGAPDTRAGFFQYSSGCIVNLLHPGQLPKIGANGKGLPRVRRGLQE